MNTFQIWIVLFSIRSLTSVKTVMSRRSSLTPDLSVLPADLLELKDGAFYDLVQEITSSDEAELLRIQSVRSVHSFMRVNVLNFFQLDSNDLVPLQSRLAHKRSDGKYVVHLGVRGNIIYLTELFNAFKKQKSKGVQTNLNASAGVVNITSTPNDSISSSSIQLSDHSANCTPPYHLPITPTISFAEHRTHIRRNIPSWWHSICERQKLPIGTLLEPDDYKVVLDDNSCSIVCSCGTSVLLRCPTGRKYYQLSNYYQHVIGSEKCNLIKRKQRDQEMDDDSTDSHLAPSSRTTTRGQMDKRRLSSTPQQKSKKTRTQ